jgi:hypothetical protein
VRALPLTLLGVWFAVAIGTPDALGQASQPVGDRPVVDCRSAAQTFEARAGLPPGLLLAIGQVESGRTHPLTGIAEPWPWATNHAGGGHYFASAAEAIGWVALQQASGSRSIDVGCFQVNLYYHPDAFASLAEAFEPASNARYAAEFLNRLHAQSGSWPTAIAQYHSADPFEGQRYADRVIAAWNNGGRVIGIPDVASIRSGDPVVVRTSAMASAVRVVMPSWAVGSSVTRVEQPAGLPRVYTPSR